MRQVFHQINVKIGFYLIFYKSLLNSNTGILCSTKVAPLINMHTTIIFPLSKPRGQSWQREFTVFYSHLSKLSSSSFFIALFSVWVVGRSSRLTATLHCLTLYIHYFALKSQTIPSNILNAIGPFSSRPFNWSFIICFGK